jgi:oligopeptide transport system ATP-binding protein
MSIGRLLPTGARIAGGHIVFFGSDIVQSSSEDVRLLRGRDVAFVFQDPNAALDPTMRVGRQITESLEAHKIEGPSYWREKAADLLTRVGIRDAWRRLDDYPHQFSGGMRQRAMIAAALIAGPRLLVADEPTSALDVTVQAQIIKLINELSADMGLAIIFITHDLSVARLAADRVAVMYAGVIVEYGPAGILLKKPHHPYTQALLALAPHLATIKTLPDPIPGTPVPAWQTGDACPFAGR